MAAENVISNLRNRRSKGSLLLINEYQSTARLRIELPVPTKKLWNMYFSFVELLTGDRRASWDQLATGKKVSNLSMQMIFMLTTLTNGYLLYLSSSKPNGYAGAYTLVFSVFTAMRVIYLGYSRKMFELLDFQYLTALLTLLAVGPLGNNATIWKTAVALQMGNTLISLIASPDPPSVTFSNKNSLMKLQKVLITHGAGLALYLKYLGSSYELQNKMSSVNLESEKVVQEHFGAPIAVFLLWSVVHLFTTEVVYARALYRRGKTVRPQKSTMKSLFMYNKHDANSSTQRQVLVSTLKNFNLVAEDVDYAPEKNQAHHTMTVMTYMFLQLGLVLVGLPFGFLFAKVPGFMSTYLFTLYVYFLYRGAVETTSKSGKMMAVRQPSVLQSVYSSGSSALDEGGDEPAPVVTKQENIVESSAKDIATDPEEKEDEVKEEAEGDAEEMPVPVVHLASEKTMTSNGALKDI